MFVIKEVVTVSSEPTEKISLKSFTLLPGSSEKAKVFQKRGFNPIFLFEYWFLLKLKLKKFFTFF